jgi:cytochrome c-type biogenesis protein CcmE
MLAVGLALAGLAIAAALTLRAFEENMMFYIEIAEVAKGNVPKDRNFRVGGLVVENSVKRQTGELELEFTLTDLEAELPILYSGVLPDLFREGQGIIAHGRLNDDGKFVADTVLAKRTRSPNTRPPKAPPTSRGPAKNDPGGRPFRTDPGAVARNLPGRHAFDWRTS